MADAFQAAAGASGGGQGEGLQYRHGAAAHPPVGARPAAAKAAERPDRSSTTRLALQDAAGHISDEAGKFSDTGNLAQSFGADPATSTGGIEVLGADATAGINGRVFSSLPYAVVMEDGRRPGARSAGKGSTPSGCGHSGSWG
jgi:hypothetical protein